jgi:hypothetical protein
MAVSVRPDMRNPLSWEINLFPVPKSNAKLWDAVHLCMFRCDRLISCARAKFRRKGLCSFQKVECPKGVFFEAGKPGGEISFLPE